MKYAAFLLGINLGKRSVKMADLKRLMEKQGFKNVQTVVASGNVIFDAPKQKPENLVKKLETAYEKHFGFTIGVIVRTMDEIESILKENPFKKVKMTKDIRRYVVFLSEKPPAGAKPSKIDKSFEVLKVTKGEVYSVLDLSKIAKTPDVMKFIGQTYGKKQTMRNWNTVEKVAALS